MSFTSALPLSLSLNPFFKGRGQTASGHINQSVRLSVYMYVWETRYLNPQLRRCTDAAPERLCLLIWCIIICSQPNWGGVWLHKAAALWNTKYLMENPLKVLLQLEVRDGSSSEEQLNPRGTQVHGGPRFNHSKAPCHNSKRASKQILVEFRMMCFPVSITWIFCMSTNVIYINKHNTIHQSKIFQY